MLGRGSGRHADSLLFTLPHTQLSSRHPFSLSGARRSQSRGGARQGQQQETAGQSVSGCERGHTAGHPKPSGWVSASSTSSDPGAWGSLRSLRQRSKRLCQEAPSCFPMRVYQVRWSWWAQKPNPPGTGGFSIPLLQAASLLPRFLSCRGGPSHLRTP